MSKKQFRRLKSIELREALDRYSPRSKKLNKLIDALQLEDYFEIRIRRRDRTIAYFYFRVPRKFWIQLVAIIIGTLLSMTL